MNCLFGHRRVVGTGTLLRRFRLRQPLLSTWFRECSSSTSTVPTAAPPSRRSVDVSQYLKDALKKTPPTQPLSQKSLSTSAAIWRLECCAEVLARHHKALPLEGPAAAEEVRVDVHPLVSLEILRLVTSYRDGDAAAAFVSRLFTEYREDQTPLHALIKVLESVLIEPFKPLVNNAAHPAHPLLLEQSLRICHGLTLVLSVLQRMRTTSPEALNHFGMALRELCVCLLIRVHNAALDPTTLQTCAYAPSHDEILTVAATLVLSSDSDAPRVLAPTCDEVTAVRYLFKVATLLLINKTSRAESSKIPLSNIGNVQRDAVLRFVTAHVLFASGSDDNNDTSEWKSQQALGLIVDVVSFFPESPSSTSVKGNGEAQILTVTVPLLNAGTLRDVCLSMASMERGIAKIEVDLDASTMMKSASSAPESLQANPFLSCLVSFKAWVDLSVTVSSERGVPGAQFSFTTIEQLMTQCETELEVLEANEPQQALLDHKPRVHLLKDTVQLLLHAVRTPDVQARLFPFEAQRNNLHHVERRLKPLMNKSAALVRRVMQAKSALTNSNGPLSGVFTGGMDQKQIAQGDALLRNAAYRVLEPYLRRIYNVKSSSNDAERNSLLEELANAVGERSVSATDVAVLSRPLQSTFIALLETWRVVAIKCILLGEQHPDTDAAAVAGSEPLHMKMDEMRSILEILNNARQALHVKCQELDEASVGVEESSEGGATQLNSRRLMTCLDLSMGLVLIRTVQQVPPLIDDCLSIASELKDCSDVSSEVKGESRIDSSDKYDRWAVLEKLGTDGEVLQSVQALEKLYNDTKTGAVGPLSRTLILTWSLLAHAYQPLRFYDQDGTSERFWETTEYVVLALKEMANETNRHSEQDASEDDEDDDDRAVGRREYGDHTRQPQFSVVSLSLREELLLHSLVRK